MSLVAPAITVESLDDYRLAIERLYPFAQRVHIDITDGEFAPTNLLAVGQLYWPDNWTVDIHAMVSRPSEYIQALIQLHPSMVIFHAEVQEDLMPSIQWLKQAGIQAGVALQRPTVPKSVQQLIEAVDHVMIFSGDLGKYGGKASLMQLEKVRLIRMIRPSVEIGWDGGANVDNVFSLAQGGVDVINAGGAISSADDPSVVYKRMMDEIAKQRVI